MFQLKRALERAEVELKQRQTAPLHGELQQWLQLTYEVESKHYDIKREAAEKQLIQAKEMVTTCSIILCIHVTVQDLPAFASVPECIL